MNRLNHNKYRLGKLMASRPDKQLRYFGLLVIVIIIFVGLLSIFIPCKETYWRAIVSFLSPVPMTYKSWEFVRFLAYLIGLVVFSGVLIATITNMILTFGERYTNGTAHYKIKSHILFLGFDEMMIGSLRNELANNPDTDIVIAVPTNVASVRNTIYQYLTNEQSEQVIVMQASRVNVDDLRTTAQVQTAKRIYIIGQPNEDTHDANNLKCLGTVVGLCTNLSEKPLCMYYMRNHATFSLMQRQNLDPKYLKECIASANLPYDKDKVKEYLGKYCEPFNFHESAARKLLFNLHDYESTLRIDWHDEANNLAKKPNLQPHLVIVGMTEMGTALAKAAMMTTHYPNKKLKITFVDNDAYEEMHYFTGRYDTLFDSCKYEYKCLNDSSKDEIHSPNGRDFMDVEFEFIQGDIAHPKLKEMLLQCANNKDNELLTIAVCTNDAPQNMAFVLYLSRPILETTPIWIYQKINTGMTSFLDHKIYKRVRVFSLLDIAISIPGDAKEYEMAKKVAHTYDVLYGCECDWSKKDATERWSSLYNALSIIIKLRWAGYGIRLAQNGQQLETFDVFNHKTIDSISLTEKQEYTFVTAEHNRWNFEKLMAGFVPTTEQQHRDVIAGNISSMELKKNFIHDDIRPFEELSKSEQEKDFTLTRSLINMINNS